MFKKIGKLYYFILIQLLTERDFVVIPNFIKKIGVKIIGMPFFNTFQYPTVPG